MPELPEVETVRRGIEPHVVGRRIERVAVHDRRLRWPVPRGLERRLAGRTVARVDRRAKYLLLELDGAGDASGARDRVILHLGMSGRLLVLPGPAPARRHDHLDLHFSGGTLLRLHDPRRFGAALWWPAASPAHRLLSGLGPEPLSGGFDGDYLFRRSRGRTAPVKSFLMDGRNVVGVGNIYASESLFRAGIRPHRRAGRLSRADCARLAGAVRSVLADAIEQGGTTLRDAAFSGAKGEFGDFAIRLSVYDRAGQPCPACGARVRRVVTGQRSSYYCPKCQR